MDQLRLSTEGFRTIMMRLRSDEMFRKQFFLNAPSQAGISTCGLSKDDNKRLAALVWESRILPNESIDEKLVLCSSSGY